MEESPVDQHYEDDFEFPLWTLIEERAEKDDISYAEASELVVPEYVKTIRYRDTEYEDAVIAQREKEVAEKRARDQNANY